MSRLPSILDWPLNVNHPPARPKPRPMARRAAGRTAPQGEAGDPRWILAQRTAELLQGAILPPENRRTLNRLGAMLGLTPFDTALVIAVVQDQARRQRRADRAPLLAMRTLSLIGRPKPPRANLLHLKRFWQAMILIALTLAVELAIVLMVR